METVNTSPAPQTKEDSLKWAWRPVKRRMLPGCDLFREGDTAMHITRKLIPLENDDSDEDEKPSDDSVVKEAIPCGIFGCTQTFETLLSYENHYKSVHSHVCLTCKRTFPSDFLLDVHIQENHDPLFAVLASRQDMYRCLVESCDHKFRGAGDRRQHMVTVHRFPANFRFHSLRPNPQHSQPRHQKKPAKSQTAASGMEVDKPASSRPHKQKDDATGSITHSTSTQAPHAPSADPSQPPSLTENCPGGADTSRGLDEKGGGDGMEVGGGEEAEAENRVPRRVFVPKVPHNFSFGHGVSRGFQRPPGKKKGKKKGGHWHQQVGDHGSRETTTNIETVDMKDMADALTDNA